MTMTENTETSPFFPPGYIAGKAEAIEDLAEGIGRVHRNKSSDGEKVVILPEITVDRALVTEVEQIIEELRTVVPVIVSLGERMAPIVEWWADAWAAVDNADSFVGMVNKVMPRSELDDLWYHIGMYANAAQNEDRSDSALDVKWFRDLDNRREARIRARLDDEMKASDVLESNADEGTYDGDD